MTNTPAPQTAWHEAHTAGIPDVDGRPFAQVFAEHFAPLDQWEAEHGTIDPDKALSAAQVFRRLGLEGREFGRDRGMDLEYLPDDYDEVGPLYLAISTRNGGGNRECWREGEPNSNSPACMCVGCTQQYRIPTYPGYVMDADDADDGTYATNFFAIPDDMVGENVPKDAAQRAKLENLASERKYLAGGLHPWFFLPNVDGRARRTWGGDDRADAVTRAKRDLESAIALFEGTKDALNEGPKVTERPKPMRRRRRGAFGKELKGTEPVPIPQRLDVAWETYRKSLREQAERRTTQAEYTATIERDDVPESVKKIIAKQLDFDQRMNPTYERSDAIEKYQYEMCYLSQAGSLDALAASVERAKERVERAQAALDLSRDSKWWAWPGDYDQYRLWCAQH